MSFTQQPRERLDYDISLKDWLKEGDTIDSATMVDDDGNATADDLEIIDGARVLRVWISAGVAGERTKQTALIETVAGRTKEVEFTIKIRDA